jgi:hypothetical protein
LSGPLRAARIFRRLTVGQLRSSDRRKLNGEEIFEIAELKYARAACVASGAGPEVVVCPHSRGNEIDFDVHGRNTAQRRAEPASTNLPRSIKHNQHDSLSPCFAICRRFFRQPEDTEDAAAEVFLKLHKVPETRDEALSFRVLGAEGDRPALHCAATKKTRERCVRGRNRPYRSPGPFDSFSRSPRFCAGKNSSKWGNS